MNDAQLFSGDRAISAQARNERAARAATGFATLGLGAGDAVALLLRNDIALIEASQGAGMLGAYAVPINWHFRGDEVAYILGDCTPRALIIHADLLPGIADRLPPELPILVVVTPADIAAAHGIAADRCAVPPDRIDWDRWLESFTPAAPSPIEPPAAVIYTSGTTGQPKGVKWAPLLPEVVDRAAAAGQRMLGYGPDARTLITGPMYHSAPNAYCRAMLAAGAKVWLSSKFDAEALLRAIERDRLSHLFMVPTMFVRLLQLPPETRARYDVSSLRHVVHAAAPCPPDIKRAMIAWWGEIICEFYGSTEIGTVTYCTAPEWLAHPGTVGRAIPEAIVKIFDRDFRELPPGEIGDVYAKSGVHSEFDYHNKPDKRAEMGHAGLFTAGDIGYLDADGFLFLSDRRNDVIISGGVNIYPAEIEACLLNMPGIRDCAVFGIPHDVFGEQVAAVIQPAPGVELTADAVRDHARSQLASYKLPQHIVFSDDLPREDSGKIMKRKLRAPYWQDSGRSI
jgi:long-chain acyl-CoA synthetase